MSITTAASVDDIKFRVRVNAKLGGVNAVVDALPINDPNNPTIVMGMIPVPQLVASDLRTCNIGADVIHPAPGAEGRPSFTSLVSSVDQYTAKYLAISKVQTGRQERIEDLQEMVKYALGKYRAYRQAVEKVTTASPARLIFYRGSTLSWNVCEYYN